MTSETVKLNTFQQIVAVFNLQLEYEELIEEHSIAVPRKHKILNDDSAKWCASTNNRLAKSEAFKQLKQTALFYLIKKSEALNTKIMIKET